MQPETKIRERHLIRPARQPVQSAFPRRIQALTIALGLFFAHTPVHGDELTLATIGNRLKIGGCFVSASVYEFAGIGAIFGLCLLGLLLGLRLIIGGSSQDKVPD